MTSRSRFAITVCLVALAACTSVDGVQEIRPAASTAERVSGEIQWWAGLQDPLLDRLVASGRDSGLDVLIAETQIDENAAFTRTQFARLFPSLSFTGSSDFTEFPDGSAGLRVDWELDVFGAVRASVKAAKLRGLASEAVVTDIRRLVSSQIVATYIQLRARQVEAALARQSALRLTESLERIERLSNAGYATALDLTRSTRQLNEVSSRIESLRGQERALQNALRQLVGNNDDLDLLYSTSVAEDFTFPRPPDVTPDPDTLFDQRPDLRAAILSVNAEAYEQLSARRSLYPSISLQGNGVLNDSQGAPLSVSGISTSLIGSLVVPLIGRGRLLAQIDAENAQADRALLEYEQTVLGVVNEIDTTQAQLRANRAAADEQRKALEAAAKALELSNRLFEAGEISYLDVLITEQSRIDSERAFVLAEEAAALAWVQYMTALAIE